MHELSNLIVRLAAFEAGSSSAFVCDGVPESFFAWIDEEFGGTWSSEAYAGSNIVAFAGDRPIGFATIDAKDMRFKWLRGVARESGVGVFGPFGVARSHRGTGVGQALLGAALTELRKRGYARALIGAVGDERLIRYYRNAVGAEVIERYDVDAWTTPRPRTVVMVSGNGTNLQAVLDASASGALPIDVTGVACNNPRAYALERASRAGVPVTLVPWKRAEMTRAQFDAQLIEAIRALQPDLILLLGWMHLLSDEFVRAFPSLLNLHPAFLPLDPKRDDVTMPDGARIPAFRGPRSVADAIAAGSRWTGATVHAVTASTDRGPVVARRPLQLQPAEEEEAVMARLHPVEHEVVATSIKRWIYERP